MKAQRIRSKPHPPNENIVIVAYQFNVREDPRLSEDSLGSLSYDYAFRRDIFDKSKNACLT